MTNRCTACRIAQTDLPLNEDGVRLFAVYAQGVGYLCADCYTDGTQTGLPLDGLNIRDLPPHVFVAGECYFCQASRPVPYESYVSDWEANTFEGEPGHRPWSSELYAAVKLTCNR